MQIREFGVTEGLLLMGGMIAILALVGGFIRSSAKVLQSYGLSPNESRILILLFLAGILFWLTYKINFLHILAYLHRGGA